MTVTRMIEFSKAKMRIEIDYEFAFVLYKGELHTYGIRENEEISEENYKIITEEVLPKRVRLRALNLLSKRAYTIHQLSEKLKDNGYSQTLISNAIEYVSSFHYIDDYRYATDFIEYNKEQKSKMRIMNDLQQKGISKDLFLQVWEEVVGGDSQRMEIDQIVQLVKKKKVCLETADYAEKQKLMAFLYRKGFSMENIRKVVSLDITPI